MADPLGLISTSIAGVPPLRPWSLPAAAPAHGASFKEALIEEIRKVDQLQSHAERAVADLASGARDDLESVILATQKADAAFRMLLQVRNRVMEAYEEVKRINL